LWLNYKEESRPGPRPKSLRRTGEAQLPAPCWWCALDAELQGRAGHHRQGARGAQLAHGAGHRLRRHGGSESSDPRWIAGDAVLLNGWGVGESHWGGWRSARASRATGWCPCPPAFTAAQAMAIGTAGYTAMLCVMALERHGVKPAQGPVLVTGANGGVGSGRHCLAGAARLRRSSPPPAA
jgi:NADPH-dependent curcumin reductase CurA